MLSDQPTVPRFPGAVAEAFELAYRRLALATALLPVKPPSLEPGIGLLPTELFELIAVAVVRIPLWDFENSRHIGGLRHSLRAVALAAAADDTGRTRSPEQRG